MLLYQFDGSYEGLITSFYYALKNNETPIFSQTNEIQLNFLDISIDVITDMAIYKKMEAYLINKCTYDCFDTIHKAFLHDQAPLFNDIFYFIKKAMIYKEETLFLRTDNIISNVLRAKLTVERETHKMIGFLRFIKVTPSLLSANYSPTNNVTSLLCHHFTERYKNYNFVINDMSRNIFAIYDQKKCVIGTYSEQHLPQFNDIDDDYEYFFKIYHHHIAIPERKNLRLQSNFMPKKYWKHLIEMKPVNNLIEF